MDTVKLKINGMEVEAPAGSTIIQAANLAGVRIPSLCYLKDLNEIGACRICMVEVKGAKGLVASCVYPVNEGMEVFTNTEKVRKARKMTLELILSNHRMECLTCRRSGTCELQALAQEFGVDQVRFQTPNMKPEIEDSAIHLVRENSKCVLCRRCVAACQNQGVGVIGCNERGFATEIGSPFGRDLVETACISCGQCIVNCPTGALTERDDTAKVWAALENPEKHVVVATAPSVRAGLGECFCMPIGTNVEGKMVAALRRLGFNQVFDVDTAADFTIIEEGSELLNRIKEGGTLPLITSCSPGWVRYAEQYHPDFLPNISSCKSPQGMFGSLMKTYYAEKMGIDPKDLFVVSVMPCTAKKFEANRPELGHDGMADVDYVLTTRELARMIKEAGIDFVNLPDEDFDSLMGESTGAAVIFGATGGVMEAALRTAYEAITGKTLEDVNFTAVRGMDGIKEASVKIGDLDVNVAVASSTGKASELLEMVKKGEKNYTFIEIMGCPGGCVNGGGQPIVSSQIRNWTDIRPLRAKALYDEDAALSVRKSHELPAITKLYDEYFGKPNSHKAHELLHTTYTARKKYN